MKDIFEKFSVKFLGAIPNSPAEKAGMKKGDIILSVNGKPTHNLQEYLNAASDRKDIQKMDILRDNKVIEIMLVLNKSEQITEDNGKDISKQFEEFLKPNEDKKQFN